MILIGDLYSGWRCTGRVACVVYWQVMTTGLVRDVWLATNTEGGVVRVVAVEIIDWVDGSPLWLVIS